MCWGNFPNADEQADGVPKMIALTHGNCHIKYNPARYDLAKIVGVTKQLRYQGGVYTGFTHLPWQTK